jgi:glycosyltransferase involved in cell wall biosynthesis
VVLTVFDMIHERFPGSFPPTDRTAQHKATAVARADHVVCISHSTRSDLIEMLGVAPHRTSVVHLGHTLQTAAPRGAASVDGPYVLYVGQRGGYKNFLPLARALAASAAGADGIRLVAFGGGPFTASERAELAASGYDERRVEQRSGGDDELARLYAHASALAYPSLYEGFGIPPLEAMALDCPVVCSNTSSLPEVVGEAAELFDPCVPASMTAALDRVLLDAQRADALRARGRARVAQFSWERCAAETHAVYAALR